MFTPLKCQRIFNAVVGYMVGLQVYKEDEKFFIIVTNKFGVIYYAKSIRVTKRVGQYIEFPIEYDKEGKILQTSILRIRWWEPEKRFTCAIVNREEIKK